MPQMTACFLPQRQRGGYGMIRLINAAFPYCPIFFVFSCLPLLFSPTRADREKSGETIATPPKRGFPVTPTAPQCGGAVSGLPGGRYRRYLSLREGSEKTPLTARIKRRTALWNCG